MEIRTRAQAIEHIAILIEQFQIAPKEIAAICKSKTADTKSALLPSVLSYLGGVFILCGIGVFIAMKWNDMNSAARIIATLGSGTVALILGVLCHKDSRYQKAVAPLLVVAAGLQLTGILVAITEIWPHGNDADLAFLIASGVLFLVQVLLFTAIRRTSLVFLMMSFGFAWFGTYAHRIGIGGDLVMTVIGTSIGLITYHLQGTMHRVLCPFWYFVASGFALYSGFSLIDHTPIEILYLGICAGTIYLSTYVRSTALLFNGTLALIGYLGYFSGKHFANTIGWPMTLILMGLVMMGIGSTAWKIRNKYIKA